MMLSNVCRVALVPLRTPQLLSFSQNLGSGIRTQLGNSSSVTIRSFKTNTTLKEAERHFIRRAKERMGIKERAMQPTGGTPFAIGQGAVAGASIVGLGALCYYGLGMSSETGALERSIIWPSYVRDRIHTTYMYFGTSLAFTAATAAAAFRSPIVMNLMTKNSIFAIVASMGAMIGTNMLCHSIPYKEGFGAKQMAWALHSGVVGCVLAPICLMGGPILLRAALMTAGVVGGLSTIAVCAPSEKFLTMGGPLAIGLGVVFASSVGSMFLPATSALGAGLVSITMYGGLILFSGFMLYDTQRIIHHAENQPPGTVFDPVNASISIYMNTINIFIRIAYILGMGGGRKK